MTKGLSHHWGPPFRLTGSGRGHVLVTEAVEQAHLVAEVRAWRARRGDERTLPWRQLVLAGERGADVHGHHERAAVLAGAGAAIGGDAHGERVEAVPVLVLGRLEAPLGDVGGAEAGDVLAELGARAGQDRDRVVEAFHEQLVAVPGE